VRATGPLYPPSKFRDGELFFYNPIHPEKYFPLFYWTAGFIIRPMNLHIALIPAALLLLTAACKPAPAGRESLPSESPAAAAPSATPTDTPTPEPTATETRAEPYAIVEQTKYEGEKTYTCTPDGCWRDDGTITAPPEKFYPDIDADSPAIRALLGSIGLPTEEATDGAERWRRIRVVWEWMTREVVFANEFGGADPWKKLMEISSVPTDHWPTIGEMAEVWVRYGVLPVGACNSKTFTMGTLLYRVGVGRDSVAALSGRNTGLNRHFYTGVRVDGRWLHVDPTCIRDYTMLSAQPEAVGCTGTDYAHPFELATLPGSHLKKPMLLE
jgi:hypothetical protein